jgi:peptidoglycan/LPS O-acetylase OafA/YrhL
VVSGLVIVAIAALGVGTDAGLPRTFFLLEPVLFAAGWVLTARPVAHLQRLLPGRAATAVPADWRLGYRPALDGIRGIAILLVVLAHSSVLRNTGAVGVNVFFVLSGFLITTLLLAELSRTGRIDLVAFYRRRAARLLPALFLVCSVIALHLWSTGQHDRILPDVGGALAYVGNWLQIAGVRMVLTSHTWSLAVEEQFYLVWPLLMIPLVRSSRPLIVVAVLLGAAVAWSYILSNVLGAHSPRTTRGTDVVAIALLGGCLLAFLLHGRPTPRADARASAFGTLCIGASVAIVATGRSFPYLLELTTLGTVILIASQYGATRGPLTWRPLRYAGRISYGWYLGHFPIFAWMEASPAVELGASLLVSMASFHLFELPILRRYGHRRRAAESAGPADPPDLGGGTHGSPTVREGPKRRLEPTV